MQRRVFEAVTCSVAGLLLGFGEYIALGVRWQLALHHRYPISLAQCLRYLEFYTIASLYLVVPVAIFFAGLYFGVKDRLFSRWFISLLIGLVSGAVISAALLYGVYYRQYHGMARFSLQTFVPRTMIASAVMFLGGSWFSWRRGRTKSANKES